MITHLHYKIREIHDVEAFREQLLHQIPGPGVIIQTCMRLEVYYGNGEINESTARHLFRLVCGLESVFIGDTAIKSQVKKAYLEASQRASLSKELHRLFQTALRVGKLVHSGTGISHGAVSYPQAVIGKLRTIHPDLENLTISLVGINDITHNLLRWLLQSGVSKPNIVNRTLLHAENLAKNTGINVFHLDQLPCIIGISDVLILCTSAPGFLLTRKDLKEGKKQCIFDLSWPRNADPAIAESAGIRLFTLREIEQTIRQNLDLRKESIDLASLIIENELDHLLRWQEKGQTGREQLAEQMKG